MTNHSSWKRYLRFWGSNARRDLDDELAYHFEQRVAEFMAGGAPRHQAERMARNRFGDVDQSRAELLRIDERVARRAGRAEILDAFAQDVRYAVRTLRRAPGLAVACVITIALGVGANGAMFSLADALFLRPPGGIAEPAAIRRFYARTSWGAPRAR